MAYDRMVPALNNEAGKQAETELVIDRGHKVDFRRGVVSVLHPGVSAVRRDGDDRNGAGEELAVAILDRDIDHLNAARTRFCSLHCIRQGTQQGRRVGYIFDRGMWRRSMLELEGE